jgi:GH24 family phage-related lysozyme (muramidase)
MNTPLKVGPKALATIHHFEQCKLSAYRDAVGVPTIGWGMTYYPDGSRVQMGDKITQAEADAMFAKILERDFAGPVRNAIGDAPTTPAQFGAMVALAYNIGTGGFAKSSVLRRHRAGADDAEVTKAFQMWNKAGGRVLNGLVRRRNAEAALYRSDFAALERFTNGEVKS